MYLSLGNLPDAMVAYNYTTRQDSSEIMEYRVSRQTNMLETYSLLKPFQNTVRSKKEQMREGNTFKIGCR